MTDLVDKLFGCSYRGWLALGTALLFLFFTFVLLKQVTKRYQTSDEKWFQLQRAWSSTTFKDTLQGWSGVNPRAAEIYKWDNLIKLDLLYPLIYSIFFAFAYAWARGVERPVSGWDYFFFLAPFCAALFDYCENGLHLYLLRGIDTHEQVEAATFPDALVHISTILSYAKMLLFGIGSVAYVFAFIKRVFS